MNHDNDDNEDDDRVEHIHADDDSEGSGNNVNLDQMYSDFQQETLFMQPISREILLHHSINDPNITTQEELITTLNTDLMMESFIASVANSHSDLETFDWVPCSECGQCPCSWLKVRGAILMFARNRWGDYLRIEQLSENNRIKRCKILFVVIRRLKYGFPQYLDCSDLESCIKNNIGLLFQLSAQSTSDAMNI